MQVKGYVLGKMVVQGPKKTCLKLWAALVGLAGREGGRLLHDNGALTSWAWLGHPRQFPGKMFLVSSASTKPPGRSLAVSGLHGAY